MQAFCHWPMSFRCKVTTVPDENGAEQVSGQSIPAGWLVTWARVSYGVTVSGWSPGNGAE